MFIRVFRVFRTAKLPRFITFMKIIVGVLSRSLSSILSIALLLFLFIFIYSMLGNALYSGLLNN